jgi:hypothetical protein
MIPISSVGRASTGSDSMPNVSPDDGAAPKDASMLEAFATVVPTPTPLWIQSEFKYYKYLGEFAPLLPLACPYISLVLLSSFHCLTSPYLAVPRFQFYITFTLF